MSDSGTPKRPNQRVGRLRTRPPPRDPRAESSHPLRGDGTARRPTPRPGLSLLPTRLANLEAELALLKEARGLEADDVAAMLVRVADAERAVELAERKATDAERTTRESAAALARMGDELEDARRRTAELEASLVRARREHTEALGSARRGPAGRAGPGATAGGDEPLGAARDAMARAAAVIEDIERREETATAIRARALAQARRLLSGHAPPVEPPAEAAVLPTPRGTLHPRKPSRAPDATTEVVSFEDLDLDLPE